MSSYKQLILKRIVRNASRHFQMSQTLSLIIHAISNLQVMAVIFYAGFAPREDFQQGFFSLLNIILSVSGIFEFIDPFQEGESITGIIALTICFGYILCQCLFILYAVYKLAKQDELTTRLSKIFFVGLILHSKILFFPIQLLFVKLIAQYFNCDYQASDSVACQDWAFSFAIMGFIFNIALAFVREIYLNQIQIDQKNFFASKDNSFTIISLLQKSISLPFIYIFEGSRTTILILNIFACLVQVFILQRKLPFYDLAMLKLTISINMANLCLAPLSLARLYYQNEHVLSLVFIIMTPMFLKTSFIYFNRVIHAIRQFYVTSPEQAAHFPVLIDRYTDKHALLLLHSLHFQEGAFYFHGTVAHENIDTNALDKDNLVLKLRNELYVAAIKHCVQLLSKFPNSELLILTMAYIFLEKLQDAPNAIKLLRKFGKRNLSLPGKNAIDAVYIQLEDLLTKSSQNGNKPEFLTYLQYQEVGSALRNEIYNEIGQHMKFWEHLSQDLIDDTQLAVIAERINVSHKRIHKLWQANFLNFGASFSSIYLLYGIYLDTIRGLPNQGLAFIKKGRDFFLQKRALRGIATDIITDNNAVIVASIEPEKIGKIIDASTSVGQIFNIQRQRLIGMKINSVLPKIVAEKHDLFVQRYYNSFRYNLNKKIISYARTLDETYFPVESILRLYPSLHEGLSVLSYIKKCSGPLSLMILNQNGKIVECSKDIQKTLNIQNDKEGPNINRICPDLTKFVQAFNIIYLNKEESMSITNVKPSISIYCEKNISDTKSVFVLSSREDSVMDPLNPTRSGTDKVETMDFLASPKERSSPKKTSILPINKETAQALCLNLKEGKRLRFYPAGANLLTCQENIEFITQLEPYELDGEFYKILKLRRIKGRRSSHISVSTNRSKANIVSQNKLTSLRGDDNPLPTEDLMSNEGRAMESDYRSEDPKRILLKPMDQNNSDSNESSISIDEEADDDEDGVAGITKLRQQISKKNPSSITNSTRKTLTIIKRLEDIFAQETSNVERKMTFQVIYSTVVILAILLCVSLVFTQSSLKEMERDVVLLDAVDSRLYLSATAWQYLLIVYLRPAGIRLTGSADSVYKSRVNTSGLDMLNANQKLSIQVNGLDDEDTISVFFQKDITFYDPITKKKYEPEKLNSFVASQILYSAMLQVAKFNGSLANIGGMAEPLFAINNTANDYFIKAEEDTSTVEKVVNDTVSSNIQLLDILLVIQCLFLVRVVGSIMLFMRTIFMSHKRMLQAIAKIKRSHIAGRSEQIKRIFDYLKNDLELNKFDKIPMLSVDAHAKKFSELNKLPDKKFVLKGTVLIMVKYALVPVFLVTVLCSLCVVSFYDSVSAFSALDVINKKLIVTHNLGSSLTLVLPNYYFLTIFQNNTDYKLHNGPPKDQVIKSLNLLSNANQILLDAISDGENSISDPIISKVLMEGLCDFLDATTKRYCLIETKQNSFGLLGLNSRYYSGVKPLMYSYMEKPTLSNAIKVFNSLSEYTTYLPIVLRKSYEFLSNYYLGQFHEQTSEKLNETYTYFIVIMILNFVSAFAIKSITLDRYKVLNIVPRKIMRLVPYNVILDSRVIIFYLKKEFSEELGNMKSLL